MTEKTEQDKEMSQLKQRVDKLERVVARCQQVLSQADKTSRRNKEKIRQQEREISKLSSKIN